MARSDSDRTLLLRLARRAMIARGFHPDFPADPPVEGRIERGADGLDVGDQVRLRLLQADPESGFIDFARIGHAPLRSPRAT
jgi:hypothetical protein